MDDDASSSAASDPVVFLGVLTAAWNAAYALRAGSSLAFDGDIRTRFTGVVSTSIASGSCEAGVNATLRF